MAGVTSDREFWFSVSPVAQLPDEMPDQCRQPHTAGKETGVHGSTTMTLISWVILVVTLLIKRKSPATTGASCNRRALRYPLNGLTVKPGSLQSLAQT